MKARDKIIRAVLWLLVILWMAVIFGLSAETANVSSQTSGGVIRTVAEFFNRNFNSLSAAEQEAIISGYQAVVRKLGHISEYAVLGVLCTCALFSHSIKTGKRIIISLCICLLYAVSDEIHQLFVAGRSCQISDICFDFFGSMIGTLLTAWVVTAVRKRIKSRTTAG